MKHPILSRLLASFLRLAARSSFFPALAALLLMGGFSTALAAGLNINCPHNGSVDLAESTITSSFTRIYFDSGSLPAMAGGDKIARVSGGTPYVNPSGGNFVVPDASHSSDRIFTGESFRFYNGADGSGNPVANTGSPIGTVLTFTYTLGTPPGSGTGTFTVTIVATPPTVFSAATPATFVAANTPFPSYTFASNGDSPLTYTLNSGSLPNGLTLDSSGLLHGTPTVAGAFTFTVKSANGGGNIVTPSITITVVNVTTNAPSGVGASTATLNGSINPGGPSMTATFQYGLTTGYGSTVAATPGTVTGSSATAVSANLTGLIPGATYHYCAAVTSGGNTALGADQTFTIASASTASVLGTPAFTNAKTGAGTTTQTLASYSVPAGTNVVLVVAASAQNATGGTAVGISGVTFGGNAMTLGIKNSDNVYAADGLYYYKLGSPSSATTGDIVVTVTGTGVTASTIGAIAFQNVDQTTPLTGTQTKLNAYGTSGGTNISSTVTVPSNAGDIVMDFFDFYNGSTTPVLAAGAGQIAAVAGLDSATLTGNGFEFYDMTLKAGAASVPMSWTSTGTGESSLQVAANIKSAAVAAPTVTSISPTIGSTAGGTVVTITGTGFTGATGVTIGGTAVTGFTVNTDTQITATTAARGAGANLSVLVTTGGGTNAANTLYTYVTPPPPLNPGDIVVLAMNAGTDTVTFATLVPLPPGTVLNFTDQGWDTTNAFTTAGTPANEGVMTWTTTSTIPAGTVFTAVFGGNDNSPAPNLTDVTAGNVNRTGEQSRTGWTAAADTLLNTGDSWLIYQGSAASPTFLFGFISNNVTPLDAITGWNTVGSNTGSVLPSGLTNGTNAVNPFMVSTHGTTATNVFYSGPVTPTDRAGWLARVVNTANWSADATNAGLPSVGATSGSQVNIGAAAPTVTQNTSNLAQSATTITIAGTGFSTTPGNNTVTFTPTGSGTVTAATATSLTVTGVSGLSLGALNAVVAVSGGGNSGAAVQVANIVATPNAVAVPSSQTTTSGTAITPIALSGSVGGTTFNWTRDNAVAVTGVAASGAGNISGTLTNTTNAPVTVTFTITPTANSVTGSPTTATVTVNPTPTVNAVANQALANGAGTTAVTFSGNVAGTVFNWTNNTPSIGLAASGSGNIASFTATNATNAPVVATITVTPSYTNAGNTSTGTPVNFTITVNPTPNAVAVPSSQTTASGTAITPIALSGSVGGTTFNWTRDNAVAVTGVAASGAGNISGALTNTTNAPVTVTFTITPTANSVTGPPTTATVTVNPGPATHFAVSAPASATAGTAFNFTVTAQDAFNNTVPGYAGTVNFTGTDAQAVLPANSTLTNGTGTFSATLKAAGSQTLTATDTVTGSITGTSNNVTVSAAAAHHVAFGVQPTTTVAGVAISPAVTVRVLDQFNNLVATDTSNVTVAIGTNPGGGTLSGTATVAAVGGVATFSTLSINKAGTGYTLTATDGALTGATSVAFNITPAAANHLAFGAQPSSTVAGAAISPAVTVSVLDQFGNLETTDSTSLVTLAIGSNPGGGTLSGGTTVTVSGGVATFSTLNINKTGTGYTLTAADGALTGATSAAFNITSAAATHFTVSAPASATAGTSFNFTVTALDAFNNTATGYAGTAHFTGSDGAAVLPSDSTLVNGVGTFSATLKTAGSQTLTATDTVSASITGTSNAITVSPAAATHFTVSAPASGTAGTSFNFTVTALDQFNNTATGYAGTAHFTSTDGQAVLPANSTLASGVGTFSATLKTAGNQTLTVTDTASASITGTSNAISVSPAAATHFTVSAPASGTAGSAFNFTVTALDPFNNTATGYAGTAHFTGSDGQAVLPADSTVTNGVGTFSATLKTVGSQTVTATDTVTSSITGTSNAITVSPAAANHFVVSVPASTAAGTPFSITVTALDPFNNTATAYAGTAHFTSSDGAATLPGNYTFLAGDNGVHTFLNGVTLATGGNQTVTATDTVNASITGTSGNVNVVQPPIFSMAFNPAQILVNGTSSLTFTIVNPAANTVALTGVGFTLTLPAGVTVPNSSSAVGGGTLTVTAPNSIVLTGATVGANGQLQFSVTVTGVGAGTFTATTSPITSANGGTGSSAVATLTTNRPPNAGPVFAARAPSGSLKIPVAQIIAAAPDPDAGDVVTLVSVGNPTAPAHGTANYSGNGTTGFVFYTPNPGDTNGDTFSYTVTDNHGAQATSVVNITVNGSTTGAVAVQTTKMTRNPDGSVALNFAGVPGYTYGLQFTNSMTAPVTWTDIGHVTINTVGQGQYLDTAHNASPNVFYRFIYPAP